MNYGAAALIGALLDQGKSLEEAQAILAGAASGDVGARGQIAAATRASDKLPYNALERPRFLEEGLPIPPDYALWLFIIYSLKRNPEMLEKLALKWMDTQQHIIGSLAQAGAGNIITAYTHSFLIALMLEQNYMIRQRGADDLISSLNWIAGAAEIASIINGFTVPATLVYAGMGGDFPKGTAEILAGLGGKAPTKEKGGIKEKMEKVLPLISGAPIIP